MRQAEMRQTSALPPAPPGLPWPPTLAPTPWGCTFGHRPPATVGQNRPAGPGPLMWGRGDVETDCSFFLFLSYCHLHDDAVILLTGLQEVGVGGSPCCPPWEVPNHFLNFILKEKQKV